MKKFLVRGGLFVFILICLYSAVIYGTSKIKYNEKYTIFNQIVNNPVKRGGATFIKFYEATHLTKPVDILVIGSSRAFRSFDPDVFEKNNLHIHLLATSSQAPVNTYYLLKEYLLKIRPKMVIFDVHLGLLNSNGIECFYDLCTNIPVSKELFEMALDIDQANTYSICYAALINQADTPIYKGYAYKVPKGYRKGFLVDYKTDSTLGTKKIDTSWMKKDLTAQEIKNLKHIDNIARFVRSHNVPILFTKQPVLSREKLLSNKKIHEIATKYQIKYLDLNKFRKDLNFSHDFYDQNHLNTYGAEKISEIIIKEIQNSNFIF